MNFREIFSKVYALRQKIIYYILVVILIYGMFLLCLILRNRDLPAMRSYGKDWVFEAPRVSSAITIHTLILEELEELSSPRQNALKWTGFSSFLGQCPRLHAGCGLPRHHPTTPNF